MSTPDEPMDPNQQVVDEFRATGGTPGGRLGHLPLLLLTTTGARSGHLRTVPLTYVAYGEQPQLLTYQAQADRDIAIVLLTPVASGT